MLSFNPSIGFKKKNKAKATLLFLVISLLFSTSLQASEGGSPKTPTSSLDKKPDHAITIIGGGIAGAMEAYQAYKTAQENGQPVDVTIYEKNESNKETTASNNVPSLTPDEILSVVPRGKTLEEKLKIPFDEPGGILVSDVKGVNHSESAKIFKQAVQSYSKDENGYNKRTEILLQLGKMSMDAWQEIYDKADPELKNILRESNFNPCCEPKTEGKRALHEGYRIDLLYNIPNAKEQAENMKRDYEKLGYEYCQILSPEEVIKIDPFLTDFCLSHSEKGVWKKDTIALWRPGGCIDTHVFLPKFYNYLEKVMGQHKDKSGQMVNNFKIIFKKELTKIDYNNDKNHLTINGFHFRDGSQKQIQPGYKSSEVVFCPGEAVGTLHKLGLNEPPYAGFAGASLRLHIPIPHNKLEDYANLNHCMEVQQIGIVLAWQARRIGNKIFIGVAGTKAFYGDQHPHKDQAFARNRNLLQLNMMNDVLPEFVSLALGRDTKGQKLGEKDLYLLEEKGIAKRWVGTRAVAYDGFPTLGPVYHEGQKVENGRVTTHLGSGGVSFAPATISVSQASVNETSENTFIKQVLTFGDSKRTPKE